MKRDYVAGRRTFKKHHLVVSLRILSCLGCTMCPTQIGERGIHAGPQLPRQEETGRFKLPEFWPADHQPQGGCGEATGGQVCIRHIRPQDGVGGWTGSAVRTREASAVELVVERVFLRVSRALGTRHSAGAATRSQTVCSPAARQVEGLVKRQLQDGPEPWWGQARHRGAPRKEHASRGIRPEPLEPVVLARDSALQAECTRFIFI